MDDTFALFRKKDHVELFRQYLNAQHQNIQFTSEIESEGKLAFLDVLVSKNGDRFETGVYRKSTFTGLLTRFDSFVPFSFKQNLVSSLLFRAFKICSSYVCVHEEFERIKKILAKNSFPISVVDRAIARFWNSVSSTKRTICTVPKLPLLFVLPYTGSHSLDVKKRVRKLFSKYYPQVELRVVFRSSFRVRNLFHYKDRLPNLMRSSVIYKFCCGSCNATYIGKTKRQLKIRINEHIGKSSRTGNLLKRPPFSAIREHSELCGYNVCAEDFCVIGCARNEYDLCVYENLLISRDKPSLNVAHPSGHSRLF